MNEAVYRIRDRAALAQLASEGIHVLHLFDDELVLSRPLDRDIDGLVRVTDLSFAVPEQLRPGDLAGLAYRLRQTASFRASKTRRPTEGLSMDLIIRGKTGGIA